MVHVYMAVVGVKQLFLRMCVFLWLYVCSFIAFVLS